MATRKSDSNDRATAQARGRRRFLKQSSLLVAGSAILPLVSGNSRAANWTGDAKGSGRSADVVVETTAGKVRGTTFAAWAILLADAKTNHFP